MTAIIIFSEIYELLLKIYLGKVKYWGWCWKAKAFFFFEIIKVSTFILQTLSHPNTQKWLLGTSENVFLCFYVFFFVCVHVFVFFIFVFVSLFVMPSLLVFLLSCQNGYMCPALQRSGDAEIKSDIGEWSSDLTITITIWAVWDN